MKSTPLSRKPAFAATGTVLPLSSSSWRIVRERIRSSLSEERESGGLAGGLRVERHREWCHRPHLASTSKASVDPNLVVVMRYVRKPSIERLLILEVSRLPRFRGRSDTGRSAPSQPENSKTTDRSTSATARSTWCIPRRQHWSSAFTWPTPAARGFESRGRSEIRPAFGALRRPVEARHGVAAQRGDRRRSYPSPLTATE